MKLKQIFEYSIRNPDAIIPFILALPRYFKLFWRLIKDSRVSLFPKVIFILSLIYFISPLDFLPELFNPVFGYCDDVLLFIWAARFFIKAVPPELIQEHLQAMGYEFNGGK
jgi:uncharacterized membrane protein YkvA (DUF1232 family)